MSINHEIKGMLARLLATEDLIVEHKKVETACFNVHTRVLTLPLWERASSTVYDMLVGHEVGHALFTPDEDWCEKHKIPKQFLNVTEDARIEKLMKRKYAGLSKCFYGAYKELSDQDFFALENEDVPSMNLADRANLYFKIGNFIDLEFTDREKDIIKLIDSAETFEDAINAAKVLYEYCKEEENTEEIANLQQQKGQQNKSESGQESTTDSQSGENESQSDASLEDASSGDTQQRENSIPDQEQTDAPASDQTSPSLGAGNIWDKKPTDPQVKTDNALKNSIQNLASKFGHDTTYVEIPQVNLNTVVIPNNKIHDYIKEEFSAQKQNHEEYYDSHGYVEKKDLFYDADLEYMKFKNSAQKEVNYLVKEFEMRKSADQYSRSSLAKTGVLDCTKLHNYKFSEDLFKKVTTVPEGKNHGLVFVLDWSGSMANVLLDTLKQLYNLIWFCKKVNIPFEVYAFTGEWVRIQYDDQNRAIYPDQHYQKKDGLLMVHEQFSMLQFFKNGVSSSEFEQQMKNIWRICYAVKNYVSYAIPGKLSLSGTPLNEALISLHQILPKFQKNNKIQKVQCVVLTDGEANHLPYHTEIKRYDNGQSYIGHRQIGTEHSYIRDRKIGTTYKIPYAYYEFTNVLLRNLKDRFPSVNFIGMRILENRDAGTFIRRYCGYHGEEASKATSDWRKNKSFSIKVSGYDAYFGLSSSALSHNTEFDVAECASKSQIKNAFVKSLNSKKMNKKILGEFVELVA
jgi:hypothetical protein